MRLSEYLSDWMLLRQGTFLLILLFFSFVHELEITWTWQEYSSDYRLLQSLAYQGFKEAVPETKFNHVSVGEHDFSYLEYSLSIRREASIKPWS